MNGRQHIFTRKQCFLLKVSFVTFERRNLTIRALEFQNSQQNLTERVPFCTNILLL